LIRNLCHSGKGESTGDGKDSSAAATGSVSAKTGVEVMAFSQETMLSKEKHEEQLRKFQLEMRARTIAAPTNDYVCGKLSIRKICNFLLR
jgi:hypothetical protein